MPKRIPRYRWAVKCFECGKVSLLAGFTDLSEGLAETVLSEALLKLGWTNAEIRMQGYGYYYPRHGNVWLCPTCSQAWPEAQQVRDPRPK